ncbi:MAG TPA: cupin domain-containing protein [Gemmatimonadaceae bacterium]
MKAVRSFLAVALVTAGFGIGIAVDRAALAQQPGIKRTILLRADDPADEKYEAVMGIAEIPPGGSSGKHRHPGIEIAYVLEGSIVAERAGKPTVTIKAGESIDNGGLVHNATNSGTTPAKILAIYLVEKGKPIAESVP